MSLLHHHFDISHWVHKTTEKIQNIRSKSHRLNTLHVMRGLASRNRYYFRLAPIGMTR